MLHTVAILAQGTNWAVAETQAFLLTFGSVFEPPRGHPDSERASAHTAARLLSGSARVANARGPRTVSLHAVQC